MLFALQFLRSCWILAGLTQTFARPYPSAPLNLTFAGVTLPDTPSVRATHEFITQYLDAPTYNHVVRSVVFSLLIQSKLLADPMQSNHSIVTADPEVVTVAGLLHDMSWNVNNELTKQFISQDKRFEVDGADVAREFLKNLTNTLPSGSDADWDDRRLQLVWDSIALHATISIFEYKEPEVALAGHGIMIDVLGLPNATFPGVPDQYLPSQQEYDDVYTALPSLDIVDYLTSIGVGLCVHKPETTYDNIVSGFGEVYVKGYTLQGHRFVDLVIARGEREHAQNNTLA